MYENWTQYSTVKIKTWKTKNYNDYNFNRKQLSKIYHMLIYIMSTTRWWWMLNILITLIYVLLFFKFKT
jgi:hypothetical protein